MTTGVISVQNPSTIVKGIGTEYHKIKLKTRIVLQYGQLHENPGHQQKHQTTRCNVVERSDGVERNALAGQQNLDQDQPSRLKGNRTQLKTNPPGIKSGLAVGGNGDAERDGEHVNVGGIGEPEAKGGNGERPIVHFGVQDILVVDNDGEAEEDPEAYVGVRKEDLPQEAVRDGTASCLVRCEKGNTLWFK
ncbi:unnamed protein product, partial [Vitis vinifera]